MKLYDKLLLHCILLESQNIKDLQTELNLLCYNKKDIKKYTERYKKNYSTKWVLNKSIQYLCIIILKILLHMSHYHNLFFINIYCNAIRKRQSLLNSVSKLILKMFSENSILTLIEIIKQNELVPQLKSLLTENEPKLREVFQKISNAQTLDPLMENVFKKILNASDLDYDDYFQFVKIYKELKKKRQFDSEELKLYKWMDLIVNFNIPKLENYINENSLNLEDRYRIQQIKTKFNSLQTYTDIL
jgi:hypothetical protein